MEKTLQNYLENFTGTILPKPNLPVIETEILRNSEAFLNVLMEKIKTFLVNFIVNFTVVQFYKFTSHRNRNASEFRSVFKRFNGEKISKFFSKFYCGTILPILPNLLVIETETLRNSERFNGENISKFFSKFYCGTILPNLPVIEIETLRNSEAFLNVLVEKKFQHLKTKYYKFFLPW